MEGVAFSPDGHYVLTRSSDSTARLWDTSYHDIIANACMRVFRDLTDDERKQYAITDDTPICSQFAAPTSAEATATP